MLAVLLTLAPYLPYALVVSHARLNAEVLHVCHANLSLIEPHVVHITSSLNCDRIAMKFRTTKIISNDLSSFSKITRYTILRPFLGRSFKFRNNS